MALDSNGQRELRAPCYAPVDIELRFIDTVECMALWTSVNQVHFADGSIDYLSLIVYHDNDIGLGTYSPIGTVKRQGEVFNHTGTGGNVTGDHVHIETGKGLQTTRVYHFTDSTTATRIVPDEVMFVNDTIVTPYPRYTWIDYTGGGPTPPTPTTNNSNKWLRSLATRKIIIRR